MENTDAKDEYYEMVIKAIEAIKNSRFNAPGWPVWMALDDLPDEPNDNEVYCRCKMKKRKNKKKRDWLRKLLRRIYDKKKG